MRIVVATGNAGKLKEIKDVMADTAVGVCGMADLFIEPLFKESGETFAENALIKASYLYDKIKEDHALFDFIVMADDSGLCIDYLKGRPGVHSSRFMGHETSYDVKCKKILDALKAVPDGKRSAAFICHITIILRDGIRFDTEGRLKGFISHEVKGEGGFGYDPIFYLPQKRKTLAELTTAEKDQLSHRFKALSKMKKILLDKGLIKRL